MAVLIWLVAAVSCAGGFDPEHCRASSPAAIAASHSSRGRWLLLSLWRASRRGTMLCPCNQPSPALAGPSSASSPASPGTRQEMMPHARARIQHVPLGIGRSWLPPSLFPLPQALTFPTEIPEIGWIIYWLFPDCCLFGEIILEIRC